VDKGVDSIMGLGPNIWVEIVTLAGDRELSEPVLIVRVCVPDLRSCCQCSALVERQDAGATHPAATHYGSAFGSRPSDGLRQGLVTGSEVQVLNNGCSELVPIASLLPGTAAGPGFTPRRTG
jgi:hypothetical protein